MPVCILTEPVLHRVDLPDGCCLHYLAAGAGAPLVLLHGGLGDCFSWGPLVPVLAGRHRVIAYSRRHHHPNGPALMDTNHSCRQEAEDLGVLLETIGCGPAHLVGASYGALTALAFAIAQPAQIRSLVLAEPPLPSWARALEGGAAVCDAFTREVWHPAKLAFAGGHLEQAMRVLCEGMRGPGSFAALTAAQRIVVMRNARAMQALVQSSDPFPDLPRTMAAQLGMPVLLINGARTVAIHRLANAALAAVLPRAEQMLVANAGHGVAGDDPVAFETAVVDFLERLV